MRRLLEVGMEAAAKSPEEKDQKEADKHAAKIHKAIQDAVDSGHEINVSVAGRNATVTTKRRKARSTKRSA